jgi:hypothetical protein
MNRHEVLNSVYQLAAKESQQNRGLMRSIQGLDINFLGCRLRGLACVAGKAKTDVPEDILAAFFSTEALSYLLEMPNPYCFWTTVRGAAIYQEIMGGSIPISLRAVKLAFRRLVEELAYYHSVSAPGKRQIGQTG